MPSAVARAGRQGRRTGSRFLVSLHEPAVADHVGGQNCGKAAFHAQSPSGGSLATWAGGIYRSCAGAECPLLAQPGPSAPSGTRSDHGYFADIRR